MTDPLGQSQVLPYLMGLTKYGYSFTILSCDKAGNYSKYKDHIITLLAPFNISWISIPYHKRPPVLSSYYDVIMLKRKASQLHKKEKFDMVHTRPGIPALVGLWLKKKYSIRFLNDVRGFWADERVDGGMFNMKNPLFKIIYKWFKRKEYESLAIADANTCLTYSAKKEIESWQIKKRLHLTVIPCSTDLDLFNPDNIDSKIKNSLKEELNIKDDDCIISYIGSVGGWYLTDEMMQFCKKLSSIILNARFLFITPHKHNEIIEVAEKHGISANQMIIKSASRHEVPALLSFSNYSVFFIKSCYSKISSSPTKHGEIMAMGIPVITNAGVGDVKEIVEKYNSGFVLDDFSDANYDACIQAFMHTNFDRKEIRKGAEEFYSLNTAVEKYKKVYDDIFKISMPFYQLHDNREHPGLSQCL